MACDLRMHLLGPTTWWAKPDWRGDVAIQLHAGSLSFRVYKQRASARQRAAPGQKVRLATGVKPCGSWGLCSARRVRPPSPSSRSMYTDLSCMPGVGHPQNSPLKPRMLPFHVTRIKAQTLGKHLS